MADVKITALTVLTAADPINDAIPIVDVSNPIMAASGTTSRISINNLLSSSPTATGALTVTGLVTAGSATITGAATVGTTLGVTGVSTLASAVVTGALTVDTTTLVVDATNNRVGIGTATPATTLDVAGAATITGNVTVKSGNALILNRTDNLTSTQLYDSGSTGFIIDNLNTSGIKLMFGGVTSLTLNPTANLVLKGGTAAANGVGLTFPATQVASSDANCLDDYEEGTFLPTVIGTSSPGTVSYARQLGRYTKVGNLVTVQIYLSWSGGSGGTGDLAFGGLPFAIAGNANEYASAAIGQFDNIALTALNVPSMIGSPNATFFNLNQFPVGGGASTGVPYDAAGAIIITSTYIV